MMSTLNSPAAVAVSQALLVLNAAVWLVLGAWYLIPLFSEGGSPAFSTWILVGLMFANTLAMLLVAWGIGKRRRLAYFLANILLSVTDEFGLVDLIVLLLGLAILVLLIAGRSNYLPPASDHQPSPRLLGSPLLWARLGQAQSSGQPSPVDKPPTTRL